VSEEEDFRRGTGQGKRAAISFLCGVLFAVGLGLAGMTSPAKVLAFLDVTSRAWDPSLAFVMAGAIGVHFFFARRALRVSRAGGAPVAAPRFYLPEESDLDRSLLVGAALFGIGWGLAGYCPGPALVSFIVTPTAVIFVGAMLAGMWGTHVVRERLAARAEDRERAIEMERELTIALAARRSSKTGSSSKPSKAPADEESK
jgi:uncharacterized membrane protein YedE/YeeE